MQFFEVHYLMWSMTDDYVLMMVTILEDYYYLFLNTGHSLVKPYATHLATKWRNRLLSSTVELRLGDQSISINHLYSIIDNGKFTKIDDGLTKSDINPKDRQNFSSCVKLASDDLF
ncbi:unnamed protein product [Rotaria magnacalcarata]|uniref:Uncharacterized protein n=1 Tax=Rotaria magnacalcarata TaxID=392030 RepID=A0A8S3FL48_9BILA|nr:unnamed protein product [Rotaria magnacalcarata]CAF5193003.1 unnamed protein product [Rotaria magnacalcarata]